MQLWQLSFLKRANPVEFAFNPFENAGCKGCNSNRAQPAEQITPPPNSMEAP